MPTVENRYLSGNYAPVSTEVTATGVRSFPGSMSASSDAGTGSVMSVPSSKTRRH